MKSHLCTVQPVGILIAAVIALVVATVPAGSTWAQDTNASSDIETVSNSNLEDGTDSVREQAEVDKLKSELEKRQRSYDKYEKFALVLWAGEKIDGPTAIMILGIGSAILHTIASLGLWFLSAFVKPLQIPSSNNLTGVSEMVATTSRFVVYYLIGAIAATLLTRYVCHLEVMEAIGFVTHERVLPLIGKIDQWEVDTLITGMIMWLGSERVGHWLQIPGGPLPQATQPIVISGDLQLQEPAA